MEQPEQLDRLRAGDEAAFAALVRQYHRRLQQVARALVGSGEAEEVVQEAWLSAWRALPRFEGRASLKTWLTRIVINAAFARRRRQLPVISLDQLEDEAPGWSDCFAGDGHWQRPPGHWRGDTPEALLQQGELGRCLEQTLATLPGLQRAVFMLRTLDEQSAEEVCNALGISESNLRVLLHRARLRLFQTVERYQETGDC